MNKNPILVVLVFIMIIMSLGIVYGEPTIEKSLVIKNEVKHNNNENFIILHTNGKTDAIINKHCITSILNNNGLTDIYLDDKTIIKTSMSIEQIKELL